MWLTLSFGDRVKHNEQPLNAIRRASPCAWFAKWRKSLIIGKKELQQGSDKGCRYFHFREVSRRWNSYEYE